jgi:hypothetical protein
MQGWWKGELVSWVAMNKATKNEPEEDQDVCDVIHASVMDVLQLLIRCRHEEQPGCNHEL